jgi:hypothetical protein
MGAIFAKVISTANNYLFSRATNLVNNVFARYIAPEASNKRVLIVSRLMVVLLGIWALYQALGTESVLQKALNPTPSIRLPLPMPRGRSAPSRPARLSLSSGIRRLFTSICPLSLPSAMLSFRRCWRRLCACSG